jgi:small subunit ribosomal protein S7
MLRLTRRLFSTVPNQPDELLMQVVNTLMRDGKKQQAQGVVSRMLHHIRDRTLTEPVDYFHQAIIKASPLLMLLSTKKGSKSIPVPFPLKERQRRRRAIVWLLDTAGKRTERKWEHRLGNEVINIMEGTSSILTKKEQVHKQALAARANVTVFPTQRQGRRRL